MAITILPPAPASATSAIQGLVRQTFYHVRDYGAVGDGATDDSTAIAAAITAASTGGGGHVQFASHTTYRAAGLTWSSGVRFHLPHTSVIKAPDGTNLSMFVANGVTAISMAGGGELDGNAAKVAGVLAPVAPGAPSIGSAGSVGAGTWFYYYTYSHANGESNPSPASASVVADGSHRINVPVTASPNITITGINLYRSTASNGTSLALVGAYANTTATVVDNTASASGAVTAPMAANQGQTLLSLTSVSQFRVEGLYLHDGPQSCISVQLCDTGVIHGVDARRAGNDNVLIFNACHDITVSDCVSQGTTSLYVSGSPDCCGFEVGSGVNGTTPYNITFASCTAFNNYHDGFFIDDHDSTTATNGPTEIVFAACVASGNGAGHGVVPAGAGFRILHQDTHGNLAATGVAFVGCAANANYYDGFAVTGASGHVTTGAVTFTGCTSRANGNSTTSGAGFSLTQAADCVLAGCSADSNLAYGFNIGTNAARTVLSGCKARANANHGFLFNTGSDDSSASGCTAYSHSLNSAVGFSINANRIVLDGCRGHTNLRGFDVAAGTQQQLVGCVAQSNTGDGFLVRNGAACGVSILGGASLSNTTNGIRSISSADGIKIQGVRIASNGTAPLALGAVVNTNWVGDCPGVNPVGPFNGSGVAPANPAIAATTVDNVNTSGFPATVAIAGGTITNIKVGAAGASVSTGLTSGLFKVMPGQVINVTYSVTPTTYQWYGE